MGGGAYVTFVVIGVSVAAFLAQQAGGIRFTAWFWLVADNYIGGGVAGGEYYRLLTAAFLHGDLSHLALNMVALFLLGSALEPHLGRLRFTVLYVLSALGGSAASYAFSLGPSLGASGAVFGLLGATLVVNRRLRRETAGLWILLAINVAYGFWRPDIDWRAHFGGLAAGAAVAAVLAYAPARKRTLVQAVGCLCVAGIILVVVVLRTLSLQGASGDPEAVAGLFPSVDMCCGGTTRV